MPPCVRRTIATPRPTAPRGTAPSIWAALARPVSHWWAAPCSAQRWMARMPPRTKRILAPSPITSGVLEHVLSFGLHAQAMPGYLTKHEDIAITGAADLQPLAPAFLLENLRLNGLPPLKYRTGQWGADAAAGTGAVQGQFDLIMGSDVLYERDARASLARFLDRHAGQGAQIWIVDPNRGNRSTVHKQMAVHRFEVVEERLDHPALEDRPAYKGRLLIYQRKMG